MDDVASDSDPGKWDLTHSFLVLRVNALLKCKDPSSLTVMATDANRLKRLLETIGRNDPVPGPL